MASFLASSEPPPSYAGFVSVCDAGRSLVGNTANSHSLLFCGDITINSDLVKDAAEQKPAFLPQQETKWKKAFCSWRDNGLYQALEVLASDKADHLSRKVARLFLSAYHSLNAIAGRFYPHYLLSVPELCEKYSTSDDWKNVAVKLISWHPVHDWVAVVRQDDAIEVKGELFTGHCRENHSCLLRDSKRIGVTCLQWRPHCHAMLAVGMETGLSLWNADPSMMQSRLASSLLRYDRYPGHVPVTSLAFSPDGHFLVSASPVNSTMLVWDVTLGIATPLQRIGGGGVSLVSWSPDSLRVFAATPTPMFRVWECNRWSCEKWSNLSGRCVAASWSPMGDYLLFAVEGDHCIYYIHCDNSQLVSSTTFGGSAVKCADLSMHTFETSSGNVPVGGWVQSMVWDSNGERLAVIFTKDSPGCELVAILNTNLRSGVEIIPGGFIRGLEGETPVSADFKVTSEGQTILATAWNSGRISFNIIKDTVSTTSMPHLLPARLDRTHLYSIPTE